MTDPDPNPKPPEKPRQRTKLRMIKPDVEYFEHQVDGVRRLRKWRNFLLQDEQGLGKTLSSLTIAAAAFENNQAKRILVVAPATLKGNWFDESQEFCKYSVEVLKSKLDAKKRSAVLAAFHSDILVINYEQMIRHVDELGAMGFDIVIFDEAHYLKNRKSARWIAAEKLKIARRWLLTGSPMLNMVDDLWALMHLIAPKAFPDYWVFVNRYCVFGGYDGKKLIGVKNEAELRRKIEAYSLRREKKDCLDLPAKQIIPIRLEMHPDQEKLYRQAKDELMIDMPDGSDPLELNNALTKMLRLKQIAGTTACIEGYPDKSTKLDRAVEMIEEFIASGEAVVVFTQFRKVLECLQDRLDMKGVGWRALHGDIPIDDRKPIVNEWTNAARLGNPWAMLCMVQVAGVGLTMTAASKCIFLDKLYAPKMNEQAQDRLHRIGQTGTVQVFELIMRGTIEERVEQILRRKSALFNAVIANQAPGWKQELLRALKNQPDNPDQEEAA